jgi:hypothetical protein
MNTTLPLACLPFLLLAGAALANPTVAPDGVLTEDFEDGKLDAYTVTGFGAEPTPPKIVTRKGNQLMHLNQEGRAWHKAMLRGTRYKDFVLEADMKKPAILKGYVGLSFRNDLRVFFKQQGVVMLTVPGGGGSLAQSIKGFPATKFQRLKVVCIGPIIRVYVGDDVVIEVSAPEHDTAGPIGLISHSTSASFDNVRLTPRVPASECVMVQPWAEDDVLLFPPGQSPTVQLQAFNFSDTAQKVTYAASLQTWQGEELSRAADAADIDAGAERKVPVRLKALSRGYYRLVLSTSAGDRAPVENSYPLAVHQRATREWAAPKIPLAPYWKYKVVDMKPIVKKTYVHAAANLLREHGFNAVVSGVGIDTVQVDIFKEYGLSVITRGMKCIDQESVIAGLIGDEPKADDIDNYKTRYDEMRAKTDKPLTTCMIGESLFHAVDYWKILEPDLRAFRWYGFKKSYYNLRRRLDYKNCFSFVDTLVVASYDPTPYWVILPSFGKDNIHGYYRNPLPCEMQAMMHLSLAHDAAGLLFFCLQPQGGKDSPLVEAVSLRPMDGKLAAIAEVNRMVQDQAELLASLRKSGMDMRTDSHAIELQGLDQPEPDAEEAAGNGTVNNRYFYAVNIDNKETVSARIFNLPPTATYTDVYTGRAFKAAKETVELQPGSSYETGVIRVTMAPGEGMLIKVHEAWEAPTPIAWPTWLADVPAAQTHWLMDLTAANKPKPGWLPKKKGSWKKKSWAEMNGPVTLFPDLHNPLGIPCPKSVYAQAETTIVYDIPAGCTKFVAAAGLGSRDDRSSVIFRVLVDDKPRFTSDVFRSGSTIIPVEVDVTGGKQLTLVTLPTDDGIGYDYAWWGDARLVKE